MPWDHRTVYDALSKKFETNDAENRPLTYLYEGKPDSAVLYSPDSDKEHPLHLHPGRKGWNSEVYRAILPFIDLVQLEANNGRPGDRFLWWHVDDWDGFAKALSLGNPS